MFELVDDDDEDDEYVGSVDQLHVPAFPLQLEADDDQGLRNRLACVVCGEFYILNVEMGSSQMLRY